MSNTSLNTTISNEFGTKVSTIEHLMGALFGLGIDNALIELDNEEVPILDGSAKEFIEKIVPAGFEISEAPIKIIKINKKIEFKNGNRYISIEPSKLSLEINFELCFENPVIGNQKNKINVYEDNLEDILNSRTFCLYEDIEAIKKNYLSHLDEKKLLEKNNKVLFDKSRELSLLKAIEKRFELAIFDDGLQDKKIHYDLKIVCFNSISLAGNELRLPSGPLRERLNNLRRYDAVFISGNPISKIFLKRIKKINPKIVKFNGEYVPTNFKKFKKNCHLTFSGIGNPIGFVNTLSKYGIKSEKNLIYPDHYEYSEKEINKIKKLANEKNLKILTTEKDFYRISPKLRKNINYLQIRIKISNFKQFNKFYLNIYENIKYFLTLGNFDIADNF